MSRPVSSRRRSRRKPPSDIPARTPVTPSKPYHQPLLPDDVHPTPEEARGVLKMLNTPDAYPFVNWMGRCVLARWPDLTSNKKPPLRL